MAKYLSNRLRNLKVGIESYTETTTSLSVVGKVGIGTTNAVTDLDINGSIKIDGGILDSSSSSGTNSYVITADGSGGWSWQPVSAGVVTYVNVAGFSTNSGITTNIKGGDVGDIPYQSATDTTTFVDASTASSGQVLLYNGSIPIWGNVSAASGAFGGITVYDEGVLVGTSGSITSLDFVGSGVQVIATTGPNGIATVTVGAGYATTAGIATNLKGGAGGQLVYQSAADTTAFLTNGISGYLLQANGGTNAPSWVPAAPANAITGLTIRDEGVIVGGANSVSQLNFVGDIISVASTSGIATITVSNSFSQLSVSGLSTFTGIGTFGSDLYVGGDVNIVGVLTAQRLYSTIYGEFVGGAISGDSLVGTALSISGISTLGTVQISSGIVTATSGVVTYYGDGQYLSGVVSPASNGEFYTGVSSSIQLTPLSYETSIYTFPSTAGKQYVIESINVANVDTSVGVGTTVNIIASIQDSSGEQTYIAYNVPIVNGGLIELLKNPIVAGPSDVIKMWVTNAGYIGVNNAAEVYMNYTEFTSTEYVREYASTVSIATTDVTGIFTSTTYPSVIESIHLANRTDTGDYPVSVTITNGLTTTYLARDLVIPRYSTVDILDRPKRVELNGTIGIKVGQTSTIDVIIAGKQITS